MRDPVRAVGQATAVMGGGFAAVALGAFLPFRVAEERSCGLSDPCQGEWLSAVDRLEPADAMLVAVLAFALAAVAVLSRHTWSSVTCLVAAILAVPSGLFIHFLVSFALFEESRGAMPGAGALLYWSGVAAALGGSIWRLRAAAARRAATQAS